MTDSPCEVFREIELKHLRIEDFALPDVFTSGLYSRYDVTIADLRWHLFGCSTCTAMREAGAQLRDFDKERFEGLAHILEWADGLVQERLRRQEDIAEAVASDMADAYVRDLGAEAEYSREGLVEAYKDGMFRQEVEPKIHYWAVKLHTFLGGGVNGWLETLLPPSFPRIRHYTEAGLADVRIDFTEGFSRGQLALIDRVLPSEAAGPGLRPLLRALLLDEAFGGSVTDADVVASVREAGKPVAGSGQTPALHWKKLWEQYTAFADTLVKGFFSGVVIPRTTELVIISDGAPKVIEQLNRIDQNSEAALAGQTAMMERSWEMEKAVRQLLNALERSPNQVKQSCIDTAQNALGSQWDALAEPTKRFLLTAEYGYTQFPADVDFSGVIISFTKAFETELKQRIEPFRDRLQEALERDAEMHKGDIHRCTLGALAKLLERNRNRLDPVFAQYDLQYENVLDAITKVNRESGAKHQEEKTKAEATDFRTLFFGERSVLKALLPKKI